MLDEEIKAPILVDARLPEAQALVVLLGAERGVVEILNQQQRLLVEGTLDMLRRLSRNNVSDRRQPLSNVRGSESASEPGPEGTPLESGWHSCFVTGALA